MMQLMAAQLQEHVGKDLQLKRTPRILTISGPLESYTKNWKGAILPDPISAKDLMEEDDDDDDDEIAAFHAFMKKELGEEEYEKTMKESDDDISDELKALFDIPGLGTQENDNAGIAELMRSMLDEPEAQMKTLEQIGSLENQDAALKLVGYMLPNGKSYSLVHLLKPYVLVGKYIPDENDHHFELLSPQESLVIEPQLSKLFKDDLEKVGLELFKN